MTMFTTRVRLVPGRQVWLTIPVVVDGQQLAAPGDLVCIVSIDGLFRRGLTVRIPGGDTVAVGVRDVALHRGRPMTADELDFELQILTEFLPAGSSDWEVITSVQLSLIWDEVEAGRRRGPMTYAGPPGVMSGMSRDTAIRLARASGALPPE